MNSSPMDACKRVSDQKMDCHGSVFWNRSADFQSIDAYVTSQMQALHLPGVALGIVKGDQIVHLQGVGVTNPAGQPVTAHTPFILGSTSKSFSHPDLSHL